MYSYWNSYLKTVCSRCMCYRSLLWHVGPCCSRVYLTRAAVPSPSHRIKCFELSSPAIRFVKAYQADGLYLACRLFLFDDSFLFLRLLFWNIMKCSKHLVMAKNMFGTFWIVSSIFITFGTFQDGLELGFFNIWNNVEMFETFWIVCNILKCLLKFSRTEVFINQNIMKCSTYFE